MTENEENKDLINEPILQKEHLEKEGYQLMAEKLVGLPWQLHIAREEYQACRRKIDDLNFQKKMIERRIFSEVVSENITSDFGTENEKTRLAYPNEKSREIEVADRCRKNKAYYGLVEEEIATIKKQGLADLRLQYLKDVYNHAKLLVKLLSLDN